VHQADHALFVGEASFPEYLVRRVENDHALILVEGRIDSPDTTASDARLHEIAETAAGGGCAQNLVRDWMDQVESDYLILIAFPARNELLIFNDPFGRLPVYYNQGEDHLLVARECKFVRELMPRAAFDPVGWAELLWLGYPLGHRTLFKDIRHLSGGTLVHARLEGDRVHTRFTHLHKLNLDELDPPGRSLHDYGAEIAESIRRACRSIARHGAANIVSLSGGNDSRVVAAALAHEVQPLVAATCRDARGKAVRDEPVAGQLAAALGIEWHALPVGLPDQEAMDRLVRMMDGMNTVDMAYMLPFLEQLIGRWGRDAMYWTGDGGKILLDCRYGRRRLRSMDDLIETIRRQHTVVPARTAESIMRLPAGTLYDEIRGVLSEYPERDLARKRLRYLFAERGRNWSFIGEDRARFFLQQATPFHSLEVFRRCVRIPDNLKQGNRLLRRVLLELSPECAAVPNADTGLVIGGFRSQAKLHLTSLFRTLPQPLTTLVRPHVYGRPKPFKVPESMVGHMKTRLEEGTLGQIISSGAVQDFLQGSNATQFDLLWTLVTLEQMYL